MGKSGGAPSAPNMSQQIGNANNAYQTATSNAGQTMTAAQGYNQQASANLQSMLGGNASAATALLDNSSKNLSAYGSTFLPQMTNLSKQATDYTSAANQQAQEGMAMGQTASANAAALTNSKAALASEGVDPAAIHGGALDEQARIQGAAGVAGAGTQAYQSNLAQGFGMGTQAAGFGLQAGAQGQGGASSAAGVNTASQGEVNQTGSTGVSNLTGANTYLNTGVNANASAAGIQNQDFQNQLGAFNAKQAANNSTFQDIGAIAGAASKVAMIAEGGPMPDLPQQGIPYHATAYAAPMDSATPLPPVNYATAYPAPMESAIPQYNAAGPVETIHVHPSFRQRLGESMAHLRHFLRGNHPQLPGVVQMPPDDAVTYPPGVPMPVPQGMQRLPMMTVPGSPQAAPGIPGGGGGFQRGGAVPGIPGHPWNVYTRGGPVTQRGALPTSPIPGSTDTKPALLTPGEFVIPHDVASWKGHEHWYKQMDKAREEMGQRMGIPQRPSSALTAHGV